VAATPHLRRTRCCAPGARGSEQPDHGRLLRRPATATTALAHDVAAYNAGPGPVFCGLVQPADAVRHSDGFRMREPRPLAAELLIAAAEEAIGPGPLRLRLDDRPVDLDELITPADHDELIAVLERSVVASGS
jgi:hypothetical protein